MTELQLYKFINDNAIEWHWDNKKEDVYIFLPLWLIEKFNKLLPTFIFSDSTLECHLSEKYLCIEMLGICEVCSIELETIFEDKNN